MEDSLNRYNWLNHWPVVLELNLQPLPLSKRLGGGTESSNPRITSQTVLTTRLHSLLLSKSGLGGGKCIFLVNHTIRTASDKSFCLLEVLLKTMRKGWWKTNSLGVRHHEKRIWSLSLALTSLYSAKIPKLGKHQLVCVLVSVQWLLMKQNGCTDWPFRMDTGYKQPRWPHRSRRVIPALLTEWHNFICLFIHLFIAHVPGSRCLPYWALEI